MPNCLRRVVWGLKDTPAMGWPIMRFNKVLFPALGLPTIAIKPDLKSLFSFSKIYFFLLDYPIVVDFMPFQFKQFLFKF